jgi:hypothetical protein
LIAYTEIEILPYEGQHEPRELKVPEREKQSVAVSKTKATSMAQKPERKTVAQPTGKLASANLGIKTILNPPKRKGLDDEEALPESNEAYSEDDLKQYWNKYAYELKKARRDGLFTTLTRSEMQIGSDHKITLHIKNHQVQELESEKIKLLRFLRYNLKNTNINLVFKIEEAEAQSVMDSKATFDKLAEENGSLLKLRKMFNLDIEF